jgi:putative endonuclease
MGTKEYYVYIMSNSSYTLYVGVTSNLEQRVWQHKNKVAEGFTSRYNVTWLVYYASTNDVLEAIAREKQIKGWARARKLALIREFNPTWRDLSHDWYDTE